MGNTIGGGRRSAKIMKMSGETFRLKTPVSAGEVVKDYPGHVLLESESVKQLGIRAKPLGLYQELKPKRVYFLVELPKLASSSSSSSSRRSPRRVRSGIINMSAKDRLESLMLSRRTVSDLSFMRGTGTTTTTSFVTEDPEVISETGGIRVKMRLPKSELSKLMMESKDEKEATQKIVGLYLADGGGGRREPPLTVVREGSLLNSSGRDGFKAREKRVGFKPIEEGEIQLAVAS